MTKISKWPMTEAFLIALDAGREADMFAVEAWCNTVTWHGTVLPDGTIPTRFKQNYFYTTQHIIEKR